MSNKTGRIRGRSKEGKSVDRERAGLMRVAEAALLAGLAEVLVEPGAAVWLARVLHESPVCPECGRAVPRDKRGRFEQMRRIQCACGKQFSARAGSFMARCNLSPMQAVLLLRGIMLERRIAQAARSAGLSPVVLKPVIRELRADLMRATGLSRETVRRWRKRLGGR